MAACTAPLSKIPSHHRRTYPELPDASIGCIESVTLTRNVLVRATEAREAEKSLCFREDARVIQLGEDPNVDLYR